MDCERDETQPGWVCKHCGWEYRGTAANPRRNCPGVPQPPRPTLVDQLRKRHQSPPHLPWESVEATVAVAEKCERFTRDRCNRFPGCGGADRFLTELLYRGCCESQALDSRP